MSTLNVTRQTEIGVRLPSDFVPDPSRGRTTERKKGDPDKDAADKYERKIKKREESAELSKKDKPDADKTPLCRFFLLGKCQKGNG